MIAHLLKFRFIFCLFFLAGLLYSPLSYAKASPSVRKIQCFVTMSKAVVWKKHTVTVHMFDYLTRQLIQTFVLTRAKEGTPSVNMVSKSFDCHKYPQFQFDAHYTPFIWFSSKGKVYLGRKMYDISGQLIHARQATRQAMHKLQQKGLSRDLHVTQKLELRVQFPDDFIDVPLLIHVGYRH